MFVAQMHAGALGGGFTTSTFINEQSGGFGGVVKQITQGELRAAQEKGPPLVAIALSQRVWDWNVAEVYLIASIANDANVKVNLQSDDIEIRRDAVRHIFLIYTLTVDHIRRTIGSDDYVHRTTFDYAHNIEGSSHMSAADAEDIDAQREEHLYRYNELTEWIAGGKKPSQPPPSRDVYALDEHQGTHWYLGNPQRPIPLWHDKSEKERD